MGTGTTEGRRGRPAVGKAEETLLGVVSIERGRRNSMETQRQRFLKRFCR